MFFRYLFSTDHKVIGLLYGFTSLFFVLVGFVLVVIMRWQLAYPGGIAPETYNGLDITPGGDLIVAIGKSPVTSTDDVSRIVSTQLLPGQTVKFTVLRGGTRRTTVDVTLGERPSGR